MNVCESVKELICPSSVSIGDRNSYIEFKQDKGTIKLFNYHAHESEMILNSEQCKKMLEALKSVKDKKALPYSDIYRYDEDEFKTLVICTNNSKIDDELIRIGYRDCHWLNYDVSEKECNKLIKLFEKVVLSNES